MINCQFMKPVILPALLLVFQCSLGQQWTETSKGTFTLVTNPGGQTLGYSPSSGIRILTKDGLAFKDLNRNGQLDIYEDWRLPFEERARDLASRMSTVATNPFRPGRGVLAAGPIMESRWRKVAPALPTSATSKRNSW